MTGIDSVESFEDFYHSGDRLILARADTGATIHPDETFNVSLGAKVTMMKMDGEAFEVAKKRARKQFGPDGAVNEYLGEVPASRRYAVGVMRLGKYFEIRGEGSSWTNAFFMADWWQAEEHERHREQAKESGIRIDFNPVKVNRGWLSKMPDLLENPHWYDTLWYCYLSGQKYPVLVQIVRTNTDVQMMRVAGCKNEWKDWREIKALDPRAWYGPIDLPPVEEGCVPPNEW